MKYVQTDGGRSKYFKDNYARDCVVRALAIAQQKDYKEVYDYMTKLNKGKSCRNGTPHRITMKAIKNLHWVNHSKELGLDKLDTYAFDENKTYIVLLKGHVVCVKDGCLYDSWDSSSDRNKHKRMIGLWSNV